MKSGIYTITNSVNGKTYVGSALNMRGRWNRHCSELARGVHHNTKLTRAWKKYGASAFEFAVLEFVEPPSLIEREQLWIDLLGVVANGYNIQPRAYSAIGQRHSEQTRAKLSNLAKNRPSVPPTTRARMAERQRGRTHSDATRQKMSASAIALAQERKASGFKRRRRVGKPHTEARKAIQSATMKGRKLTPDQLARQLAALRSTEVRAKISATSKGRVRTEEHRLNIVAALQRPEVQQRLRERPRNPGIRLSAETKELLREKAKARWADPVLRAKFVQARHARMK